MSWFMTADTRRFLNAAGEFLRDDPARNTVILTVTEDLRVKAAASAGALFGWWQPDGEPVGAAFMHTPDYPLLLSRSRWPAGPGRWTGWCGWDPSTRLRKCAGTALRVPRPPPSARLRWRPAWGRWCSTPTWPTPRATPCTRVWATARWRTAWCSPSRRCGAG